ncbi:MAG TPA: pyridoxal-phosphate dependent enzyme, partial [Candidatus Obscuribacterales bacterium]
MPTQSGTLDRLRRLVRPTTFVKSWSLAQLLKADTLIASETFQHTGSFKFRAAYNVAQSVEQPELIAASSGNFGQALAYAARLLGKTAIVVMPDDSARVKIEAVRRYGGIVDLVDVRKKSRGERVKEIAQERKDARVVSAYDDLFVIEGNSTLGEEMAECGEEFDVVIVPVGGGGLCSGIIEGLKRKGNGARVYGAEPLLGNDAKRSFAAG